MTSQPHIPTDGPAGDDRRRGEGADAALAASVGGVLRAAVAGTGLRVVEYPELAGASAVSTRAEAYVLAVTGGYQVDVWRHVGFDPFHTAQTHDLSAAIVVAVEAVLRPEQRRAWRANHSMTAGGVTTSSGSVPPAA